MSHILGYDVKITAFHDTNHYEDMIIIQLYCPNQFKAIDGTVKEFKNFAISHKIKELKWEDCYNHTQWCLNFLDIYPEILL